MAFKAKLYIEEHKSSQAGLPVNSFNFDFSQNVDQTGKPAGHVSGGIITMSLLSLNDGEIMLWMLNDRATKNGKIVVVSDKELGKPFEYVIFKDAVLVGYHQSYSESTGVICNLIISCRIIDVQGAAYSNVWSAD
jgi:hypothetical protein